MQRIHMASAIIYLFVMIFLIPAKPATGEMPWQGSKLLYTHSNPPLIDNHSEMLVTSQNRLAVVTKQGVTLLGWENNEWQTLSSLESQNPVAAVWASTDRLILLTNDETLLINAADGTRQRLDLPSLRRGQSGSVGAIPGTSKVVAQIHHRTYLIDLQRTTINEVGAELGQGHTAMAASGTADTLLILVGGKLYQWHADANAPVAWHDAEGTEPDFGDEARQLHVHPEGNWIFVGTHGEGLYAVDMVNRKVHHMTTDTHDELASNLVMGSIAIDSERDTLYYTSWQEAIALAPASDPESWKVVGYLTAFTEPALHTYRSNAPTGGMAYLPESDELLFGGRWGVSVLSSSKTSKLVRNENFKQFIRTPETIPGQGAFYDFMRENKMRSIWTGSGRANTTEHFENLNRAQVNTLFYNVYYVGHDEFYGPRNMEQHLREMAAKCQEWGIKLVISARPIGSSAFSHSKIRDYDYRHWVMPSGEVAAYDEPMPAAEGIRDRLKFPCPVDEGYWERSIAPLMMMAAEIATEYDSVGGVLWELGDGFKTSNLNPRATTCVCDYCWNQFLDRENIRDPRVRNLPSDDGQRNRWLHSENRWPDYEDSQVASMGEVGQKFLAEARQIYPELSTHLALPETSTAYDDSWWYRGFIHAMHNEQMPVIISSQQAYGAPYNPAMDRLLEQQMNDAGMHTVVVPGLALLWHSPEQITERYEQKNRYSPGVFIYRGDHWDGSNIGKNHFRARLPDDERRFTLQDYIKALEIAELSDSTKGGINGRR